MDDHGHARPRPLLDHREHDKGTPAAFAVSIALNVAYLVAEVVVGLAAGSMALVADAVHNLSDVSGLVLAWWADSLRRVRPTPGRTYGLRKSSVLAALANAVLIYAAVGGIAWEAVGRLARPREASGLAVLVMASIGVVVNAASGLVLMWRTRRREDLNLRAAFMHLFADAAVSLGVALGGVAMMATGLEWIDPVLTLAVSVVIAAGTWSLLRRALDLALDAVPPHVDPEAVRIYLDGLPGVCGVHDLHVWAMSTTETALTAHLAVKPDGPVPQVAGIAREIEARFGISHTTLQVEPAGSDCPQEGEGNI